MTRWDEKEKQQSSTVSTALLMIIGIFALGFVVGAIWGYAFNDSAETTPIPKAFAEPIQHFKIILHDSITISDEAFIRP